VIAAAADLCLRPDARGVRRQMERQADRVDMKIRRRIIDKADGQGDFITHRASLGFGSEAPVMGVAARKINRAPRSRA
jgi:hypothetical protein